MASLVLMALASIAVLGQASDLKQMQFYLHDIANYGHAEYTNRTSVIAGSPAGGNFTTFGSVVVMDDPLTEGPSLDSKLVGRARGILVTDSLAAKGRELGVFMSFVVVLNDGSTIVLQGQENTSIPVQEIAIVGGTGSYRFARGYAQVTIHEWSLGQFAILLIKTFLKVE